MMILHRADYVVPGSRVSQPDAVLLGYPLDVPMSRETRFNDLSHYDQVSIVVFLPVCSQTINFKSLKL